MNARTRKSTRNLIAWTTVVSLTLQWPMIPSAMAVTITPLALAQAPLFVLTSGKANVLLIMDNSNSMDEDASGAAVGSDNPNSESEIARNVARSLVGTYANKINMGLMAYKQGTNSKYHLHNSPYDVSYNPANYDSNWTGNRASATHKKFRIENPTSAGNYIYYNIGLPFYASSNFGNSFCYSQTANANNTTVHADGFWNTETLAGPWDAYRCYTQKTGTSDALPQYNGSDAGAAGYSGTTYTQSFSQSDSDVAQNIYDFGRFLMSYHVGYTWFSNSSPGRGYLHTPIKLLDSTQATELNTTLGTSQFTTNAPTNASYPLQNAGLTPIQGTLLTAKDYFNGTWSVSNEGYTSSCYPLPESCGKNFVILLTDGLPSTDKDGVPITNSTSALAEAAAASAELKAIGVETYVVGFALPYGTDPSQLNTIAEAGGTVSAYSANNSSTLNTALAASFQDILNKVGSAASVAANSTSLSSTAAIYQATFDSADWSGRLLSYLIGTNGNVPNSPTWDSSTLLPSPNSRNIATYKPSNRHGIPFVWPTNPNSPSDTELDVSQATALGSSSVLDFLRGDASNEGTGVSNFRIRAGSKLGDIVNSSPVYVGKPEMGYGDALESVAYSSFVSDHTNRTPVIYVGGNDGMLHGFRASDGVEIMGYIPSAVYPNLASLSSKTYSHRYFVDVSPTVADVFYGGAWHTVLVGGLNGGGQSIFALDITNTSALTQGNAQNYVLWAFGDRDTDTLSSSNSNFDADLGVTYSQPSIGRMANGQGVAVFGNGYNNTDADGAASSTGNAVLYIVDIQTGNLIRKLDNMNGYAESANGTTPNGMASPALVDYNDDNIVDFIYAGDLHGNMWKFDVSNTDPSLWAPAFGSISSPTPLFTAKSATNVLQPITVQPNVVGHPYGGFMVLFGTGKYLETGDGSGTGQTTQSYYGIWDNGKALGSSRSQLLQQSILAEPVVSNFSYRLTSSYLPNWSTQHGWFMDLYNTENGNTNNFGEKQVSNSVISSQRLVFATVIPSSSVCSAGGESWLMELNPITGSRLYSSPFDVNGDGQFNVSDFTTGGSVTSAAAVSGVKISGGTTGTPLVLGNPANKNQIKYNSLSSAAIQSTTESGGQSSRLSWREIIGNH